MIMKVWDLVTHINKLIIMGGKQRKPRGPRNTSLLSDWRSFSALRARIDCEGRGARMSYSKGILRSLKAAWWRNFWTFTPTWKVPALLKIGVPKKDYIPPYAINRPDTLSEHSHLRVLWRCCKEATRKLRQKQYQQAYQRRHRNELKSPL